MCVSSLATVRTHLGHFSQVAQIVAIEQSFGQEQETLAEVAEDLFWDNNQVMSLYFFF